MNFPLQNLIQMGALPAVSFPTDSRYYNSSILTYTNALGQSFTYLARRIVPQPGSPNYATIATHTVKPGDRLDQLAATYLGDPLMYGLLCDSNGAIRPADLLKDPGTVVNITMPQGVPGAPNA